MTRDYLPVIGISIWLLGLVFVGSVSVWAIHGSPGASPGKDSSSGPVPPQEPSQLHLAVEAREGGGCPNGKTMCLVVTQGSLEGLKPGVSGTVTFTNRGNAAHELKLVPASASDPAHLATGEDQAFATSAEDMVAGSSSTFPFTVPTTVQGVYLFCHVSGHEASGMWLSTLAG